MCSCPVDVLVKGARRPGARRAAAFREPCFRHHLWVFLQAVGEKQFANLAEGAGFAPVGTPGARLRDDLGVPFLPEPFLRGLADLVPPLCHQSSPSESRSHQPASAANSTAPTTSQGARSTSTGSPFRSFSARVGSPHSPFAYGEQKKRDVFGDHRMPLRLIR